MKHICACRWRQCRAPCRPQQAPIQLAHWSAIHAKLSAFVYLELHDTSPATCQLLTESGPAAEALLLERAVLAPQLRDVEALADKLTQ